MSLRWFKRVVPSGEAGKWGSLARFCLASREALRECLPGKYQRAARDAKES